MRTTRFAALLAAVPLPRRRLSAPSAGPLQDDLKARRARAMERLGPETIAIFWSAPTRVYSADVDYEYRQESNLLYLTGIDQPDTMLVLMPGNTTRREILFIREGRRPARALGGSQPDAGGGHGPERHRDGDDRGSFRPVRGGDVLEAGDGRRRRASTTSSSPR